MSQLRFSLCKRCSRPIVWAEDKAASKFVPLNPIPDSSRGRYLFDSGLRSAIELDAPMIERAITRNQPLFIDHRTECGVIEVATTQ
jgi:hypothetical protein